MVRADTEAHGEHTEPTTKHFGINLNPGTAGRQIWRLLVEIDTGSIYPISRVYRKSLKSLIMDQS